MQMAEQNPVVNGIEIDTEKVQRMLGKLLFVKRPILKHGRKLMHKWFK